MSGCEEQKQWEDITDAEKIERLKQENKVQFSRLAKLHDVVESLLQSISTDVMVEGSAKSMLRKLNSDG